MTRISTTSKLTVAFACLLLVAADDGGCNGTKTIGGNDGPPDPAPCGDTTCAEGEACCDASCDLCAADCAAVQCPVDTCGGSVCGDGESCCDDTCCLPTTSACTPEACQPNLIPCAESMCDGDIEFCCNAPPCNICLPIGDGCSPRSCT